MNKDQAEILGEIAAQMRTAHPADLDSGSLIGWSRLLLRIGGPKVHAAYRRELEYLQDAYDIDGSFVTELDELIEDGKV